MSTGDLHITKNHDAGRMTVSLEIGSGAGGKVEIGGAEYATVDWTLCQEIIDTPLTPVAHRLPPPESASS